MSAVPATKSALPGPPKAAPATKSALRGSLDDHHHVQSAAPATKTAFRRKTPPIPCTCHEKSTSEHQNTRLPLRLPRKATTIYQNAHGTTTRAQSLEAPAAGPQILRACAVEVHMDDVERHECTVSSNELAVHARAPQRSKPQLLSITVRTPSVSTLFGGKNTMSPCALKNKDWQAPMAVRNEGSYLISPFRNAKIPEGSSANALAFGLLPTPSNVSPWRVGIQGAPAALPRHHGRGRRPYAGWVAQCV